MKKINDTLLKYDPDCVKTRKFGHETKKFPTNIVDNGIKWEITIYLCTFSAYLTQF